MSRSISTQLIAFLVGNLPLSDFEQWIYQTPELRHVMAATDYEVMMSINFQQTEAPSLLNRLLRGYIDWAQYEKEQLSELLMAIIWKDDVVSALIRAYEQHANGLIFLHVLGVDYGLMMLTTAGATARQEELLTAIYPKAREEAKRLLTRLVSGNITFTGTYTPEGHPEYRER